MSTRWTTACLIGILALATLSYLPGIGYYFVADDFRYLELASQTHGLSGLLTHIPGACTRVGWPVVILAFWVGRALGGMQPESYRLLALALHLTNALLVFLLVRRALGARAMPAALVAALVLALHPRQHESVMWLSTLTWPASTAFSLLAATGYIAWRQTGWLAWLAAAAGALGLAMICNPSTIVLPLIFAAYDLLCKSARPATVAVWLGLLVMVGALGMVCGLGSLPNSGPRGSYGLDLSGVMHSAVFLTYIIWPVPLDLKQLLLTWPLAGYVSAGLALGAVGLAGLGIFWRGNLLARWGVAWALLAVAPPAFFSAYLSDHYMSLMLVGVSLACAGVAHSLKQSCLRLAVVVALLWAVTALPQIAIKVQDWQAASAVTSAVRDATLARYPAVPDGARFFYSGLPETRRRAVIWTFGIDSAARVWYNNPTVGAVRDNQFGIVNTPRASDLILDFSGRW